MTMAITVATPTNDFPTFVKTYCPNLSLQKASVAAEAGKELLALFQTKKQVPEDKHAFQKMIWRFKQLAVAQGEGFHQGTIVFSDPDYRIVTHFSKQAYTRFSSHFPCRALSKWRLTAAYAIDVPLDSEIPLPAQKRTAIFSPLFTPGFGDYSMLKIEDWGTRGCHFFPHTWGYIKTFFPCCKQTGYQEENPVPHLVTLFKKVLPQLPKEKHVFALTDVTVYGIAAMASVVKQIDPPTKESAQLAALLAPYKDTAIRKGDEVILHL
jgi:hypothetical protein